MLIAITFVYLAVFCTGQVSSLDCEYSSREYQVALQCRWRLRLPLNLLEAPVGGPPHKALPIGTGHTGSGGRGHEV
jgi:hypothetical protein